MNKKRAVFLDRDGTINHDLGYLSDLDKLIILPKVVEGLTKIKSLGFLRIIISNQSGVARKYFDLDRMWAIDAKLKKIINKKEVLIDDSFYCPHHPDFDTDCDCRKPKIALIKLAMAKYKLNTSRSFFIGDKLDDILCGISASCKTILVPKNLKNLAVFNGEAKLDYVAQDLLDAANWIEQKMK